MKFDETRIDFSNSRKFWADFKAKLNGKTKDNAINMVYQWHIEKRLDAKANYELNVYIFKHYDY